MRKKHLILLPPLILAVPALLVWHNAGKTLGEEEKRTDKKLTFVWRDQPGDQLTFRGEMVAQVHDMATERILQAFVLQTDLVVRNYTTKDFGFLKGIRLENSKMQESEKQQDLSGELFFLQEGGKIIEFYKHPDLDPLTESFLRSGATALQVQWPESPHTLWEGSERSPNGTYLLAYRAQRMAENTQIEKTFVALENPELELSPDSRALYQLNQQGILQNVIYGLGIISSTTTWRIAGYQKASLHLEDFQSDLRQYNPLAEGDSLQAIATTEMPSLVGQSREERIRDRLQGVTQGELLEKAASLASIEDSKIGHVLNQLEDMLVLHPDFHNDLLELLDSKQDSQEFPVHLSLIMGALSTMKAEDVESSLLDYSEPHQASEAITQQTAFALAEMQGATAETYDFLLEVSKAEEPHLRTIGLLSLGALGQQKQHRERIRRDLLDGLQQASDADKSLYLAALNNSRDQRNLDVLTQHLHSPDEDIAAQAIFGLKHIRNKQAFAVLKKQLTDEQREVVVSQGVQALASHLHHEDSFWLVKRLIESKRSQQTRTEAILLLGELSRNSLEARAYLLGLPHAEQFPQPLRDYASDVLLTLPQA